MERKVLKLRSNLKISGIAIIALGIWDVIKTIINAFLRKTSEESDDSVILLIMMIIIMAIVIIISIGLRIFIGYNAISEGLGKKKSIFYVVLSFFPLVMNILDCFYYFSSPIVDDYLSTIIVSLIIELTSVFVFINMIISAIRIRGLNNKIQKENL